MNIEKEPAENVNVDAQNNTQAKAVQPDDETVVTQEIVPQDSETEAQTKSTPTSESEAEATKTATEKPKTKTEVKRAKYVKPTLEQLQSVLVVIDMQNDFVDGSLGSEEAKKIVEPVVARVDQYLAASKDVIFTRDTHFGDYSETQEGAKLPTIHCVRNTDGWQIVEQLKDKATTIIDKPNFGSFVLANACINKKYEGIEIVGLCTDICVLVNAIVLKTALPESTIVVNSQCTVGTTARATSSAIAAMKKCQIDII